MIFLVLSRKMMLLFPENLILSLDTKNKKSLFKKIPGNKIFFSNILKRWYFQKNAPAQHPFL